jgi:hypothetical protein
MPDGLPRYVLADRADNGESVGLVAHPEGEWVRYEDTVRLRESARIVLKESYRLMCAYEKSQGRVAELEAVIRGGMELRECADGLREAIGQGRRVELLEEALRKIRAEDRHNLPARLMVIHEIADIALFGGEGAGRG